MSSRITVSVDAKTWWALGELAERRGVRIADLLAEITLTGNTVRPMTHVDTTTRQKVAALLAAGKTVREIAEALGVRRQTVYYHQKSIGRKPMQHTTRRAA